MSGCCQSCKGLRLINRTQPAMKLPRKAITRAARSGRDISMRPQWLQKDKSRVGKQSEMAMRRAARRGLGGRGPGYIGRHQVASRRWLMLIFERFRGLKVTMSKVKGRRHQFALPGGPGPGMPPRIWVQIRSSTQHPRAGPGGACPRQGPVNPWIRRAPPACPPLTPPPVFQPSES